MTRPSTLDDVYAAQIDYVLASLRKLGVPERDLEDVAHDVFVAVHRHFTEWDPTRPIKPWLFAFATRVASDYRKRSGRTREVLTDEGTVPEPSTSTSEPHADDALARKDDRELVARCMNSLDEAKREILVLHDIEEVPVPEIATKLSIPVNTAYSRLRLAREALEKSVRSERIRMRLLVTLPIGAMFALRENASAAVNDAPPTPSGDAPPEELLPLSSPATRAAKHVLRTKVGAALVASAVLGAGVEHARLTYTRADPTMPAPPPTTIATNDPPTRQGEPPLPPADLPAPSDVDSKEATNTGRPSPATATSKATDPVVRDRALHEERTLLDRARTALARGDSAAALDALQQSEKTHPVALLAEEREAYHVLALVRAGRDDEAEQRARGFEQRYPNSIFSTTIANAIEGDR